MDRLPASAIRSGAMRCAGLSLLTVLCSGLVADAQPPHGVAFDVATIRRSGPGSGAMALQRVPGGRITTSNLPLERLIAWAFDIAEEQIVGRAPGLGARYDINAKAPNPEPGPGELQRMMQMLLAERFGLRTHRERREGTIYVLTVDERGLKVSPSRVTETGPNPFSVTTAGTLTGTHVTTDMLAKVLSNELKVPVQNRTNYSAFFDFTLRWQPDTGGAPAVADAPSLFTAVREQLGLRLEPQKGPIDVLVIDAVNSSPTPD
jgi:uncharacterized protein (TIGR03435 family)